MTRIPQKGPTAWAILAVAVLLLSSGCRDQGADLGQDGYLLDPPDLAELEPGDVTSGVPVLCYHYFRSNLDAGYLVRVTGSLLFGLAAALPARKDWSLTSSRRQYSTDSVRLSTST